MRPPGVTNHVSRIEMADAPLLNDDDQASVVAAFGTGLVSALNSVMQAQPGAVIVGIPSVSGAVAGAGPCARKSSRSPASVACFRPTPALPALACYPDVRRIGILTPYQPSAGCPCAQFLPGSGL